MLAPDASGGSAASISEAAVGAPQQSTITVWVKVEGDLVWVPVAVPLNGKVWDLYDAAVEKLGLDIDPWCAVLWLADVRPDGILLLREDRLENSQLLEKTAITDGMCVVIRINSGPYRSGCDPFTSLLGDAGVEAPDKKVMETVAVSRGEALIAATESGRAALALAAYTKQEAMPTDVTAQELRAKGYRLGTQLPHTVNITDCYYGWEDRVLRTLIGPELAKARAFEEAVNAAGNVSYEGTDRLLRAAPALAPFKVHVGEGEDRAFLIMPKYFTTLETRPPFPPDVAAKVWAEVSGCLKALHALGFAHGDIQARNVCSSPIGCEVISHATIAPFGTPLAAAEACIPRDIPAAARVASASLDWWMFALLLVDKACGEHGVTSTGPDAAPPPPTAEVRALLAEHCILDADAKAELLSFLIDLPAPATA